LKLFLEKIDLKEEHDALKNKNYIIITHPEEIFKK
jgi:hypothetical protein